MALSALRVSPTEPTSIQDTLSARVKESGGKLRVDWSPERYGLDYMWRSAQGTWHGVQRKEVSDLLASLDDGRLAKELSQITNLVEFGLVVIEGPLRFGPDGELVTARWGGRGVTIDGWHKRLLSIMHRGIQVAHTDSLSATARLVHTFWLWSQQATHSTGTTRPGPSGDWGSPTNRDWQAHLLQGLDGVGPKIAEAILDTLGYCPLQVACDEEELLEVPGVGPKLAKRILRVNGPVS